MIEKTGRGLARRILGVFMLSLFFAGTGTWAQATLGNDDEVPDYMMDAITVVSDWLSAKTYDGDKRAYTIEDFSSTPKEVQAALSQLGVANVTVLRNEPYARHGYVFKTRVLALIFGATNWYKPDTKASLSSTNAMENKNVTFIKNFEDSYDRDLVRSIFAKKDYIADKFFFGTESYYDPGQAAALSLRHLGISWDRLLREEIFARHGYKSPDSIVQSIFSQQKWFKPTNVSSEAVTAKGLNAYERTNVDLIIRHEWKYVFDPLPYSVPDNVRVIPLLGFGPVFVAEVEGTANGGDSDASAEPVYYASSDLWSALTFKPAADDKHQTDSDGLVPANIVAAIKKEPEPAKKIAMYFQNRKYTGYTDTIVYNKSDLVVPSYLTGAVASVGRPWVQLLRKEILARKGIRFMDPVASAIFGRVSWYRSRFDFVKGSSDLMPAGVKLSRAEAMNNALLQGREFWDATNDVYANSDHSFAMDMGGNLYKPVMLWIEPIEQMIQESDPNPRPAQFGFDIKELPSDAKDQVIKYQDPKFGPEFWNSWLEKTNPEAFDEVMQRYEVYVGCGG